MTSKCFKFVNNSILHDEPSSSIIKRTANFRTVDSVDSSLSFHKPQHKVTPNLESVKMR